MVQGLRKKKGGSQLYDCTVGIVMEFCLHGTLQDFLSYTVSLFGSERCKLRTDSARNQMYTLSAPQSATEVEAMAMMMVNSWATRMRLAKEIASALAACHDAGILHRDLTSYNVMLTHSRIINDEGQLSWQVQYIDAADGATKLAINFSSPWSVKLIDFGLSTFAQGQEPQTRSIEMHSPCWMAPETKVENTHQKASDVYSFGIVLLELVSLSAPPSAIEQGHTAWGGRARNTPCEEMVESLRHCTTTAQSALLLHALPCPVLPQLCQLILDCINPIPSRRLGSSEIEGRLESLIEQCLASPTCDASPAPDAVALATELEQGGNVEQLNRMVADGIFHHPRLHSVSVARTLDRMFAE